MSRVQVLDVDTVQVTGDPGTVANFRANITSLEDPACLLTCIGANERVKNAAYCVRIWGRTERGESIAIFVTDATASRYRMLRDTIYHRREALCRRTAEELGSRSPLGASASVNIHHAFSTQHWQPTAADATRCIQHTWLHFVVASAHLKGCCSSTLQMVASSLGCLDAVGVETAEGAMSVHGGVLEQAGVSPGSWLWVPEALVSRIVPPEHKTCTSLYLQVLCSELVASENPDGIAPLRVLSFDIECYSATHAFPDAANPDDCIITIGCVSKVLYGSDSDVERVAFCLSPTDGLADIDVRACNTEEELLAQFSAYVQQSDSDFLVGYNTCRFDWEYIRKRLEHAAGVHSGAPRRHGWGRCYDATPILETNMSSSALGDNALCYPRTPGRTGLDLLFHLKRENNPALPNLKLNTVATYYTGEKKLDLSPQQIFTNYEKGAAPRAEVARYCIQDCELVLHLVEHLKTLPNILEMSKVTHVIPEDINFKGQQIKVYAQMVWAARRRGYLVQDVQARDQEDDNTGYVGAHVVEPVAGFYTDPVLTVDFASLYPSIMRTYNLSPDTLVQPGFVGPSLLVSDDCPHAFVPPSTHVGILPAILESLLKERSRVKKLMKGEEDPLTWSLLNGKQLALKLSANSVYGACGASKGMLSCIEVASATTAAGRHIIHFTKDTIHAAYDGSEVIYGDTDSCFVRLPPSLRNLPDADIFRTGEEIAQMVTQRFQDKFGESQSYINLEMEKYFCPLILYKKKRYGGVCFEEPASNGKVYVKGIEMVRRDSIPLVAETQKDVLHKLLVEQSPTAAARVLEDAADYLLGIAPGGPFHKLIFSKSLKAEYVNPESMAHVKVVELMREREPGSEARVGERVEYLVIASETPRVVDKVEGVQYAVDHGLPPDWVHYMDVLCKPVMRLLEVPLNSLDPCALVRLQETIAQKEHAASILLRSHSIARHGSSWLSGHKTGNGTQLKLQGLAARAAPPPAPRRNKRVRRTPAGDDSSQLTLGAFLAPAAPGSRA